MDIYNIWRGDILPTQQGDVQLVDGSEEIRQRITRRLVTMPGTYIWHPEYGAGIPRFIGQPLSAARSEEIRSLILSQLFMEGTISQTPTPEITIESTNNGIYCKIDYADAIQQIPATLEITVSR